MLKEGAQPAAVKGMMQRTGVPALAKITPQPGPHPRPEASVPWVFTLVRVPIRPHPSFTNTCKSCWKVQCLAGSQAPRASRATHAQVEARELAPQPTDL